ncbi:unnamed protein product [Closterium sp. Yama58-4]|nr:unnamed protein product [Closterium sp. Yama58-4]
MLLPRIARSLAAVPATSFLRESRPLIVTAALRALVRRSANTAQHQQQLVRVPTISGAPCWVEAARRNAAVAPTSAVVAPTSAAVAPTLAFAASHQSHPYHQALSLYSHAMAQRVPLNQFQHSHTARAAMSPHPLGQQELSTGSLVLPPGRQAPRVKSAVFVKSSSSVAQCPKDTKIPEFAVIGRSNVGKSSLINMLTNHKGLAQTSKKPGKTQLINHFLINDSWYLVDLPGYGYAVAPNAIRTEWNAFTKAYFTSRTNLLTVLLLVDATIPPQAIDVECADWLGRNKIPLTVVFTKCDRQKKARRNGRPPAVNAALFRAELAECYAELPPWVMTSAVTGEGKDALLAHIAQLREFWRR